MKKNKSKETKVKNAIGDCSYCGHSIVYHAPMVGCLKCSCDEYE